MRFEELTLADRDAIELRRAAGKHKASSHAFTSLFLWAKEKGYTVAFCQNAFVVKEGERYFFPCGDTPSVLTALGDILKQEPNAVFCYAREEDLALVREVYGDAVVIEHDAASREYLYDRSEQIEMKGKKFTYQRAKCNKARRLGEIVSRPLTKDNAEDAKAITKIWASRREGDADTRVTARALKYREALGLIGNILYLDGEPIGFDLGAMIAEDTLDNHIAKTLRDDVDALMKLLWYEALPESVTVINREEDLGIRGLMIHKQDAQPTGFNETYTLYFGV